jgi:hypothetical protein
MLKWVLILSGYGPVIEKSKEKTMGNPSGMDEETKKQILSDLNKPVPMKAKQDDTDYGVGLPPVDELSYEEADVFGDKFMMMPTGRFI